MLIALLVLSLAAGVVVASWRWVVLPVGFFAVLELTPWDYSFDELAAVVAAGAIVVGLVVRRGISVTQDRQASHAVVRRQQSPLGADLLRRVVSRRALDERIDLLRLRLDTFPHGRYQPIDGLPGRVKRADGSVSRWEAMRPLVERLDVSTAVDIGANEGYFSLQLGSLGVTTVALEAAPNNYRTALLAGQARRTGQRRGARVRGPGRHRGDVSAGGLHGVPVALAPPGARPGPRDGHGDHRAAMGEDGSGDVLRHRPGRDARLVRPARHDPGSARLARGLSHRHVSGLAGASTWVRTPLSTPTGTRASGTCWRSFAPATHPKGPSCR